MKKLILSLFVLSLNHNVSIKAQCASPVGAEELSMNNVRARIMTGGDMWWDGIGMSHYEYPKGSGKNLLFAGGLWMAAIDNSGGLMTSAMQYRSTGHDFYPGPIDNSGSVSFTECQNFDRFWEVTRLEIQQHINNANVGLPIPLSNIDQNILQWPAKGNAHFTTYNIVNDLAPFVDFNNNGIYDPEYGDYPHIKGDQAFFWVINDIGSVHTNSLGVPIGIEVQCMAYSYVSPSQNALNDATFYEYKVIKKTQGTANDFYFGQFVDPDLGNSLDDFVGCDTLSQTAYTYNGDSFDEDHAGQIGYGSNTPIVSTTFLNKNMSSFLSFAATTGTNGSPQQTIHFWNYLNGMWKDGSPMTEGGNGIGGSIATKFMYPSNPTASGWNENTGGNAPSDRRYVQATGPYTLNYGDVFEITIATIAHPAAGNNDISVSMLPRIAEISQAFTDSISNGNTYNSPLSVASIAYEDIRIYPNPVSNVLSVELFIENQEATVALVDINGRTVHQENKVVGGNTLQIDMTPFTTGIYFLRVQSNGSTNHYKVIKTN